MCRPRLLAAVDSCCQKVLQRFSGSIQGAKAYNHCLRLRGGWSWRSKLNIKMQYHKVSERAKYKALCLKVIGLYSTHHVLFVQYAVCTVFPMCMVNCISNVHGELFLQFALCTVCTVCIGYWVYSVYFELLVKCAVCTVCTVYSVYCVSTLNCVSHRMTIVDCWFIFHF